MPIRINLLAEAQAAEEERRKDPVKRGIYAGVFLVILVLLWAATLQFKVMGSKRRLNGLEANWKAIEKDYQAAVDAKRRSMEAESKLSALHQMTTNRFLWGNVLNAFQQTLTTVDDVQVVRVKTDQTYIVTEATPTKTNKTVVVVGKPGAATEKITMIVEAKDTSSPSGRQVNQFKESMANVAFFKDNLTKTNGVLLTSRSAPQVDPAGNQFVMFGIKCSFPEKVR
jgi:hypothetical protein